MSTTASNQRDVKKVGIGTRKLGLPVTEVVGRTSGNLQEVIKILRNRPGTNEPAYNLLTEVEMNKVLGDLARKLPTPGMSEALMEALLMRSDLGDKANAKKKIVQMLLGEPGAGKTFLPMMLADITVKTRDGEPNVVFFAAGGRNGDEILQRIELDTQKTGNLLEKIREYLAERDASKPLDAVSKALLEKTGVAFTAEENVEARRFVYTLDIENIRQHPTIRDELTEAMAQATGRIEIEARHDQNDEVVKFFAAEGQSLAEVQHRANEWLAARGVAATATLVEAEPKPYVSVVLSGKRRAPDGTAEIPAGREAFLQTAWDGLKEFSALHNINVSAGDLPLRTVDGPIIEGLKKGLPVIIDEWNKTKPGTTAGSHALWQFLNGELDQIELLDGNNKRLTFYRKMPEAYKNTGLPENHFMVPPLFVVTLTGNHMHDGVSTAEMDASAYDRLNPKKIREANIADLQHRICQLLVGLPISTWRQATKDLDDAAFEKLMFGERKADGTYEGGLRTLGLSEGQIQRIPAWEWENMANWKNVLTASAQLARMFYRLREAMDPAFYRADKDRREQYGAVIKELQDPHFRTAVQIGSMRSIIRVFNAMMENPPIPQEVGTGEPMEWSLDNLEELVTPLSDEAIGEKQASDMITDIGTVISRIVETDLANIAHNWNKPELYSVFLQLMQNHGIIHELFYEVSHGSRATIPELLDRGGIAAHGLDKIAALQAEASQMIRHRFGNRFALPESNEVLLPAMALVSALDELEASRQMASRNLLDEVANKHTQPTQLETTDGNVIPMPARLQAWETSQLVVPEVDGQGEPAIQFERYLILDSVREKRKVESASLLPLETLLETLSQKGLRETNLNGLFLDGVRRHANLDNEEALKADVERLTQQMEALSTQKQQQTAQIEALKTTMQPHLASWNSKMDAYKALLTKKQQITEEQSLRTVGQAGSAEFAQLDEAQLEELLQQTQLQLRTIAAELKEMKPEQDQYRAELEALQQAVEPLQQALDVAQKQKKEAEHKLANPNKPSALEVIGMDMLQGTSPTGVSVTTVNVRRETPAGFVTSPIHIIRKENRGRTDVLIVGPSLPTELQEKLGKARIAYAANDLVETDSKTQMRKYVVRQLDEMLKNDGRGNALEDSARQQQLAGMKQAFLKRNQYIGTRDRDGNIDKSIVDLLMDPSLSKPSRALEATNLQRPDPVIVEAQQEANRADVQQDRKRA